MGGTSCINHQTPAITTFFQHHRRLFSREQISPYLKTDITVTTRTVKRLQEMRDALCSKPYDFFPNTMVLPNIVFLSRNTNSCLDTLTPAWIFGKSVSCAWIPLVLPHFPWMRRVLYSTNIYFPLSLDWRVLELDCSAKVINITYTLFMTAA